LEAESSYCGETGENIYHVRIFLSVMFKQLLHALKNSGGVC